MYVNLVVVAPKFDAPGMNNKKRKIENLKLRGIDYEQMSYKLAKLGRQITLNDLHMK